MLCIYMRPWTLNSAEHTDDNPLLSELSLRKQVAEALPETSGSAHDKGDVVEQSPSKRRRLSSKTSTHDASFSQPRSYADSWDNYVRGNIISQMSKKYITNLVAASCARLEEDESSDDDSSEEEILVRKGPQGNLSLVHRTLNGIAAQCPDEGAKGFGKYAQSIRLGRTLWQSKPLPADVAGSIEETFFDAGQFPPSEKLKEIVKQIKKDDEEERPAPFAGRTLPFAQLSVVDYGKRLETWMQEVQALAEPPTSEQLAILQRVRDRVLQEFVLFHEGHCPRNQEQEEPLRAFIHGRPGTGKSRLIAWIQDMFQRALGWTHGVEYICLAFQNRVAYAMQGFTLHNAACIKVGYASKGLSHNDIDMLFSRNQSLRWCLFDELSMNASDLLGEVNGTFTHAARNTPYKVRLDKSVRPFGGYNLINFGDLNQIPPIPASAAIFNPPDPSKSESSRRIVEMFWGDDVDSINYFAEITIQKRCVDAWYGQVLEECREGMLSDTSYCFLMGLPTLCAGSTQRDGTLSCKSPRCLQLAQQWKQMARRGASWEAMKTLECDECQKERDRRGRLVSSEDERVRKAPFVDAPYINRNNEPKYHAMLLRAHEAAKHARKYVLWMGAQDTPNNPAEISRDSEKLKQKLEKFKQFHDQKTNGIPGLCPLYVGMPGRVTEKIIHTKNKDIVILKHTSFEVVGWELHPADRQRISGGERYLHYLPLCIYVKFAKAKWKVHPNLDEGVFPLHPVIREWTLNNETQSKVKRRGYTMVPDFASTAFMAQGETLLAALADCGLTPVKRSLNRVRSILSFAPHASPGPS